MVKYPVGIQTFSIIRQEGYLYVDKTALVYDMVQSARYIFLSRPRRFGKSLLTSTLDCYFSGKKELFEGLAISGLEHEWTKYPVIHLDMSVAKLGTVEDLNTQIGLQLKLVEENFGLTAGDGDITSQFTQLVINLYKSTGKPVVVLIDEYDAPLLTVLNDPKQLEAMRTKLQSFYSPLKTLNPYLRFVFITGITKFSQVSIFSQLNNLSNISMDPDYATLLGITQRELESNFQEGIQRIADRNEMSYGETLAQLKKLYDGYHFSKKAEGVYNPFSLLRAMNTHELGNYWFETGTPSSLIKMLQHFHTDVVALDGKTAKEIEFNVSTEDMHSVLPFFYQSGYLTIKDYDPVVKSYTLGYPNDEVKVGVLEALVPYYVNPDFNAASNAIANMYRALWNDDIDGMLGVARSFFAKVPYQEGTLKDAATSEGHFTAMLYVTFALFSDYCYSQVRTAQGRLDIVLKTKGSIYVMEIKLDGKVDDALKQIDGKGYLIPWQADGRQVVKVGINFGLKERTITAWRVVKA